MTGASGTTSPLQNYIRSRESLAFLVEKKSPISQSEEQDAQSLSPASSRSSDSEPDADLAIDLGWSPEEVEEYVRATNLCQACQVAIGPKTGWDLIGEDFGIDMFGNEYYKHHQTSGDLIRASKSGCRICNILHKRIIQDVEFDNPDRAPHAGESTGRHFVCFQSDDLWFKKPRNPPSLYEYYPSIVFYAPKKENSTGTSHNPDKYYSRVFEFKVYRGYKQSGLAFPSPKQWDSLRTWVTNCIYGEGDEHFICRHQRSAKRAKPTRLLYLDVSLDEVKLITTEDAEEYLYITVSHCWGDPEPPKLSKFEAASQHGTISLKTLIAGLRICELPQTFQHAIQIARYCGVDYLWIDCLCIAQDKDENQRNTEWELEAEKMGDIYAGALFNVAAIGAKNSAGGLFSMDQQLLMPVIKRSAGETIALLHADPWDEFNYEISRSKLFSRAWAYQEILLAPANLFCTKEKMWWSCCHASASQTFPEGMSVFDPITNLLSGTLYVDPVRSQKMLLLYPGRYKFDSIGLWIRILESYGRTSVSYPDDRLVAIAGVANIFRRRFSESLTGANYMSGLWSEEILRQLLWKVEARDPPQASNRFTASHPIPSWSPMSYAGPVKFPSSHGGVFLPLKYEGMEDLTPDRFGRAMEQSQCKLYLRGVLVEVEFSANDPLHALPGGLDREQEPFDVRWDDVVDMENARALQGDYYRTLIFRFHPSDNWCDGLILRPANGLPIAKGCTEWMRCGYICNYLGRAGTDTTARLEQAFQVRKYGFNWVPDRPEPDESASDDVTTGGLKAEGLEEEETGLQAEVKVLEMISETLSKRSKIRWHKVFTGEPPDLDDIFLV